MARLLVIALSALGGLVIAVGIVATVGLYLALSTDTLVFPNGAPTSAIVAACGLVLLHHVFLGTLGVGVAQAIHQGRPGAG